MYSAHLHLLLNHWPIIGMYVGLGLLLVSLVSGQDQLKQASFVVFALLALISIPAYMSGNSAQLFLKDTPEVKVEQVAIHQGAALLSLLAVQFTGLLAWIGVWKFSHNKAPRKTAGTTVLLSAIVTAVLMAITGNTGGEIRHPEISAPPGIAMHVGELGARIIPRLEQFITQSSRWVWPILEDLHFFGLILIVATVGLLNLRILGFLKQLPVAPLQRFLPLGIAGVLINIVTGMLFFIGMPPFYSNNIDFQLKMVAIVAAGANLLLFCTSAFRPLAKLGPGDDAPATAKLVAVCSLFLWFAIIVLGRYIPVYEVIQ